MAEVSVANLKSEQAQVKLQVSPVSSYTDSAAPHIQECDVDGPVEKSLAGVPPCMVLEDHTGEAPSGDLTR